MDRSDWLLVVASVVLGQIALLAITFLRGQLVRKQQRDDRRDDFQRKTLLDLQDALYHFVCYVVLPTVDAKNRTATVYVDN